LDHLDDNLALVTDGYGKCENDFSFQQPTGAATDLARHWHAEAGNKWDRKVI